MTSITLELLVKYFTSNCRPVFQSPEISKIYIRACFTIGSFWANFRILNWLVSINTLKTDLYFF